VAFAAGNDAGILKNANFDELSVFSHLDFERQSLEKIVGHDGIKS
jgi:hypothetical protein